MRYNKTDSQYCNEACDEIIQVAGHSELYDYIYNTDLFSKAEFSYEIKAENEGYIQSTDTEGIGSVCVLLGAGRMKKEDKIDPCAGIILSKKTGDYVNKGDILATLYASDSSLLSNASERFISSIKIANEKPEKNNILINIVE